MTGPHRNRDPSHAGTCIDDARAALHGKKEGEAGQDAGGSLSSAPACPLPLDVEGSGKQQPYAAAAAHERIYGQAARRRPSVSWAGARFD